MLARLVSLGMAGQIREISVDTDPEYWVYVPPLSSRMMAVRKLKQLQSRNIDSFVITQGDLVNGISLGLFSKKSSSDRLLRKMAKLKIPVETSEILRGDKELYVFMSGDTSGFLDERTRSRIALDLEYLTWSKVACNS